MTPTLMPITQWNEPLWQALKGLYRTVSSLHYRQERQGLTALETRILTDTEAAITILEQQFYAPLLPLLQPPTTPTPAP